MKYITRVFSALLVAVLAVAVLPATNVFAIVDTMGPVTSLVVATPNPATFGTSVTVTATVDDTTTGGSFIASADLSTDGGTTWTPMDAVDGTFGDDVSEAVTGTFTSAAGVTQVCVRGTDSATPGNVGDQTCVPFTAQSLYSFDGFRPPIKMAGMNAQAGRAVPVKWKLTMTDGGTPVSDPTSFVGVESYQVDCTTLVGDATTAVIEKGPGKAGLHYLGNGKWRFIWKTQRSYMHSCRLMFVAFSDGSTSPTVLFRFR